MRRNENVQIVRRAYESFNRWRAHPEQRPSLNAEEEDLLHPEIEFHTYANSPEAGIYRGRDAVVEYNQRLFDQFESVRIELEELLPADDRVVVISRQHAVPKTGHAAIVVQVVEVWRIRNGLLAERHSFSTRMEALEAVGGRSRARGLFWARRCPNDKREGSRLRAVAANRGALSRAISWV
jgi:ketosteroid isomerase-like protein